MLYLRVNIRCQNSVFVHQGAAINALCYNEQVDIYLKYLSKLKTCYRLIVGKYIYV